MEGVPRTNGAPRDMHMVHAVMAGIQRLVFASTRRADVRLEDTTMSGCPSYIRLPDGGCLNPVPACWYLLTSLLWVGKRRVYRNPRQPHGGIVEDRKRPSIDVN